MSQTMPQALAKNFLGQAPDWYKKTIATFLIINPILFLGLNYIGVSNGPFITSWLLIAEFIFTLAMALKCYPLQPGGLLAIEAVAIGMTSSVSVYHEVVGNFEVILLLIFMVAGIYFMKSLLLFTFTKILLNIKNKRLLSLTFSFTAAFLSAFLDALTVTAVLISVGVGFYSVYHKVASGKDFNHHHDSTDDASITEDHRRDLLSYRSFLRSLLMHGIVGTALGGACTMVGEPQNLKIATEVGWDFIQFFLVMAPVTIPVLIAGLFTCYLLEKLHWFGYGSELPSSVRQILTDYNEAQQATNTKRDQAELWVQGIVAGILIIGLSMHWAEVGLIGLMVIVLLTAFNGVIDEHQIGEAFEEALPFTALLVVFFTIVAVIHDQHLFSGVIHYVLALPLDLQPGMFFLANGILSAISDNVFVATVYISEVKSVYLAGDISKDHLDTLAIAINTGTNLPSVATPNGQAAFLFLLTSALAPLIRLSYGRMVIMALPYTIVMTIVGYIGVTNWI